VPQQDEADIQQPHPNDDTQPEDAPEVEQTAEITPEVAPPVEAGTEADQPRPAAQLTEGEDAHPLLISAHASDHISDRASDDVEPDAGPDARLEAEPDVEPDAGPDAEPEEEAPAEPAEPPAPVKEPRRFSRAERDTLDRQQRRFAACGRCGYFVADCRVKLGEDALLDAMLDTRDGWLRLSGDSAIHGMVMDAYGVHLDVDFDLFDGTCPECRRRFVVVNAEDGPTRLKIRA
jgi:hypothetical protein